MCKRCFENIHTDITTFVQYSNHDNNYSNNENEASGAGSDSNLDDELLETYILDDNDLHMNERGNHTNNEDNNILDDDNTEKFLMMFLNADMPIDEDDDVGNNR